jgi:tRNA pseudouridine13 synthase
MDTDRLNNWHNPYLTRDLPGIGGILRAELTDFMVEEIPAYEPCGSGEHTFFRVEKYGISTMMLVKEIAQKLNLSTQAISSAGLKDKYAVARQTLCVHNVAPEIIETLSLDNAQVLWVSRHTNKLRTGHLKGNCFTIRIREVGPTADALAAPILETLAHRGVPNAYGEQRFGNRSDNHLIGEFLLRNDRESLAAHGIRRPGYEMRAFFVSAFQSSLFNQYLAKRMSDDSMDDVMMGDIARKELTGGLFTVQNPEVDSLRVKSWEISPTGPIFGYKMMQAADQAGELEAAILAEKGLMPESFRAVKAKGSRRPLRYKPDKLTWYLDGNDTLVVSFCAPKGSFATLLLDELMKSPQTQEARLN